MLLERSGQGPLHEQVYRSLRDDILAGRLGPGRQLPSSRSLATAHAISRNTVLQAYGQLEDEGYVRTRRGAGTFVADVLPEHRVEPAVDADAAPRPTTSPLRLSARAARTARHVPERLAWGMPHKRLPYDFRYGEPAFGELPLEAWWRIHGRRARRSTARQLGYGMPSGAEELRTRLVEYLARARGVRCDVEQIILVHGSQQAIDLTNRVLVDEGDRVAIEEPAYTGFSHALTAHGARLVPIPVDGDGIDVEALRRAGRVRGVFVTPSHQFPAGGILSLPRRLALLAHAREIDAFVLEDDYDGEYRYDGRPIGCLQGMDRDERVLYVGSTSKLLFPSLRIGWLVVPRGLASAFAQANALADTGSPTLEHLALADFIGEGHLERHVRRQRRRNASRRAALVAAVEECLGDAATLSGADAGLHGLLWLTDVPMARELEIRRRCAREGVGIYPVVPYYQGPLPDRAGFVLGFSSMDEAGIREGVRRLAEVLGSLPADADASGAPDPTRA